jgi:4-amino-4-deoxy-L-arabinose transferase-like glycosyltransferase
MTASESARPAASPLTRLCAALTDPARSERTMLAALAGYAAAWTLYASISQSSQDLHPDMAELIAWSRDLSLGYLKHPPLAAWLVRLWFSVVPQADWTYYLLAMLMPTSALWIVWRLSAGFLTIEKRVAGVALLMFVAFYNFLALKFNVNTVLLPAWAATTFFFLRSYQTRSTLYGALAGIGAGACMLGKYWSVFLLAGLLMAALIDSRRAAYFRSPAPWLALVAGFAVFGPHLVWLYQNNFLPLEYANEMHGAHSFAGVARKVLTYLAGSAAYVAVPIVLVLAAARPDRATIADMVWPADGERRLAAAAFWMPLLLPVAGGLIGGFQLSSLWSMAAFTLLPVVLLSPPAVQVTAVHLRRLVALAVALPVVMVIAAPAVAVAVHIAGVPMPAAHGRLLTAEVERAWRAATPEPLCFVGCDIGDMVIAYAHDRPRALPLRENRGHIGDIVFAEEFGWPPERLRGRGPSDDELNRNGFVQVCSASNWAKGSAARAARNPASRRIEVDIERDFLGIRGKPEHYVIFIIPPQR